jgi:hypothetical protein
MPEQGAGEEFDVPDMLLLADEEDGLVDARRLVPSDSQHQLGPLNQCHASMSLQSRSPSYQYIIVTISSSSATGLQVFNDVIIT